MSEEHQKPKAASSAPAGSNPDGRGRLGRIHQADWSTETQAVRSGQYRTEEQEHSEAIFPTSSFVFNSAAEAAAKFSGEVPGNIYSRFTNPTVRMFEERLAAMETPAGQDGSEISCVGTSSGMAAILATCMALLKQGDHIVSSRQVFGTTNVVFDKYLAKFGVTTTWVDLTDYAAWAAAIRPETKLLFLETPSNPLNEVADLDRLKAIAVAGNCLLVVDNCFCTPVLQQPLAFGADLIIHSATKYLDGQGRGIGGAVVGRNEFINEIKTFMRSGGFSMSPFNAWIFLKGLETLSIRMKAHCEQTAEIARWLTEQSWVEKVYYCGLPSHPSHDIAARQQSGFGGVVSFTVAGGREAAWRFIDGTRWISITANLGDVKTTMTHPGSTTHGRLTPEARAQAGIDDGLIRLCIGLESAEDIRKDLLSGSKAL